MLIGPNNEGKSNILRALVASLQFLSSLGSVTMRKNRILSQIRQQDVYDWTEDFPLSLQQHKPDGETVFDLEFKLTGKEVAAFKSEVESTLNGTLPIQLRLSATTSRLLVKKQGRGGHTLTSKAQQIARFVARHIKVTYIPAVRTASEAARIVADLVERELAEIETQPEYKAALQAIAAIQQPVLLRIGDNIRLSLQEFLPNVNNVKVEIPEDARYRAVRRYCEITIDDGTPTALAKKGDGVQSLAALSLMKQASHSWGSGRQLILAIEEPESHLHPRAVRQLKEVLDEISAAHQVILTTHCPLFVDRTNLQSNVLVNKRKAMTASNVAEIRDILGVRASDNLRNAEVVLIVEGEEDRRSIEALISTASKHLRGALNTGVLAIDTLQGGTNLCYKLGQLRDSLCTCHSLLDNDSCGQQASEKATKEGLLKAADVTHVICPGLDESEFEDMIDESLYTQHVQEAFGVSIKRPNLKQVGTKKKKWSDRMKAVFEGQGKQWSEQVKRQLKNEISDLIAAHPDQALKAHKRGSFDGMIEALEAKVSRVGQAVR